MTSPGGPSAVEHAAAGDAVATVADGADAATDSGERALISGPDAGAAEPKPYDRGPIWAMLLPPLVVFGLALWNIATPSYWRDEAATMAAVKRPFGDLIRMLGNVDAVHSAYYIFMWPLAHLFGTGDFIMRLPSALAAAVAAAFVAAIGRRLISPWVGLAAGLLYAVLPVASRYGQEARSYAMVVGAATIASYLLMRVIGAEPATRRRWLIGYGAGLAALGIVNIFGLLLLPAHAITVALHYRRRGGDQDVRKLAVGWLIAAVAGVICASPLLVLGWEQRGQIAWIAVNQSSFSTLLTLTGSLLVSVVVSGIIVITLIISSEAAGMRNKAWRWQLTELSLPWMLVPPALLVCASVISPIYTPRYLLMCVPPLALIGGMALVTLGRVAGPVALALVLLAGLTTFVSQRQPAGHYDNIRALDRIVAAHAQPGDVVLYANPNAESFAAAYPTGLGRLPDIAVRQAADPSGTLAGTSVTLSTLRSRLRHAKRVWVVEINRCQPEPELLSLSGTQEGAALFGLPLSFVRTWRAHGDWLLLYQHGAGHQAINTACNGHI